MELLVVSVLLAVVSFTSYAGLAGGVRVWRRVDASVKDVELAMAWRRIQKDVVNIVPFRAIGFAGARTQIAFPGLVIVIGKEGWTHEEVGRIRYLFDALNHQLCREAITYAELANGVTDCRPVISSVKDVAFSYFGQKEGPGTTGGWSTAWEEEKGKAPMAIRMAITVDESGGNIAKQYTASLP